MVLYRTADLLHGGTMGPNMMIDEGYSQPSDPGNHSELLGGINETLSVLPKPIR